MMIQDMKIDVVRMHRLDTDGPLKAFCDIQFNDSFVIKGFKVVEGKEGLFLGIPSEPGKNGKWFNTFLPLNNEVRNRIEEAVVNAYEE